MPVSERHASSTVISIKNSQTQRLLWEPTTLPKFLKCNPNNMLKRKKWSYRFGTLLEVSSLGLSRTFTTKMLALSASATIQHQKKVLMRSNTGSKNLITSQIAEKLSKLLLLQKRIGLITVPFKWNRQKRMPKVSAQSIYKLLLKQARISISYSTL